MGTSPSLQEGFAKWTSAFDYLRNLFCNMLLEEGESELAAFLETCFSNKSPDPSLHTSTSATPALSFTPRKCPQRHADAGAAEDSPVRGS